MQIFKRGIDALPDDVLRSAVFEKFALAERSRFQLLLATCDLEVAKRRVLTLERIQDHLKGLHNHSDSEYKLWLNTYTDRNLPELTDDMLHYGKFHFSSAAQAADENATELAAMLECAKERELRVDWDGSDQITDNDAEEGPSGFPSFVAREGDMGFKC